MDMGVKSGLAHCCHHDTHWEYCYDFDERVKFIKANKPANEQELRLKLFFLVPDALLPGRPSPKLEAFVKAREAFDKAREACDKAREAYDKAWEAYVKKYQAELAVLHQQMCPNCPFDGKTIFSKSKDTH